MHSVCERGRQTEIDRQTDKQPDRHVKSKHIIWRERERGRGKGERGRERHTQTDTKAESKDDLILVIQLLWPEHRVKHSFPEKPDVGKVPVWG